MDYLQTLNFIRQEASDDYRERVPQATRDNIANVGNAITSYTATQNEFLDALVNKIGLQLVNSTGYTNPFAMFKGEQINYGDTIEDIFVELPKGVKFEHISEGDSIDPYEVTKPSIKTIYHTLDREVQYTVTIWDDMLKRAFKSPQGMQSLIDQIVQSLYEAMTVDEFTYTKTMLSNEGKVYGKIVDIGVTDSQHELASRVLGELRIIASNMKYRRDDYNVLAVDTLTPPEEVVVVLRNDIRQAIDVSVLAGIFNLNKVDIDQRIVEVDSFDDVAQLCAVVDARGFRIHDALKDAETQRNARGRYTNYFVNHWGLVSWAKYRNAVMIRGYGHEYEITRTFDSEAEDPTKPQGLIITQDNIDTFADEYDVTVTCDGETTDATMSSSTPNILALNEDAGDGVIQFFALHRAVALVVDSALWKADEPVTIKFTKKSE